MVNDPARPVGDRAEIDARQYRCRQALATGPAYEMSPAAIQARYDRVAAIVESVDPTRDEVLAFLNGEGPLDGKHFGEGGGPHGSPHHWWRCYLAVLEAPIPMVLHCPKCGEQHVDAPTEGWNNPPHRSHLCDTCGCIWRPADVPTVGVERIATQGKADNWPDWRNVRPDAGEWLARRADDLARRLHELPSVSPPLRPGEI